MCVSLGFVIEYYKVEMLKSFTPRIRNSEIRMVKYSYVEVTIVNADVWRGKEGVFVLIRMLIEFSDSK